MSTPTPPAVPSTFIAPEAQAAIKVIQKQEEWTSAELEMLLRIGRWRKPPSFNSTSVEAQARYHGLQKEKVEAALKKQFPETKNMPIAPINWMKLIARLDAGVYVSTPDRFLEDEETGERVKDDDERAKLFAWALKKSRFHHQMAESERRALITPGAVINQYLWLKEPGDAVGYPAIELYWPHDVEVIIHWTQPLRWRWAYVVAIRQSAPGMSSPEGLSAAYAVVEKKPLLWYRVWSRLPPPDYLGEGEWGGWKSLLLSTTGEKLSTTAQPEPYPGKRLPVSLLQLSDPEGFPFVLEDTDLIEVVDDLNQRRSNESFVIGLQGHDQMWTNDRSEAGKIKIGPDAVLKTLPGSTVSLLSPNPKLADMRDSRKLALRELAISRGNSPDAYATEPGPPLSGVAKRIANLTHDVRVAEQALIMQEFEEHEALPILLDMLETYHPDCVSGKVTFKGLVPRMAPRKPPTFEEPTAKQLRLEAAVDRGWITEERGAFESEYYATIDDARYAIDTIEKENPPAPPPPAPLMPTTQKVATLDRNDPQRAPGSVPQPGVDPAADNKSGAP